MLAASRQSGYKISAVQNEAEACFSGHQQISVICESDCSIT
jgi:hypothetical protein